MSPRDYNVDLISARFRRAANFRHSFLHWRQGRRKSRGDRGHSNAAACKRPYRSFHEAVVNANCGYLDPEFLNLQLLYEFVLNRLPRSEEHTSELQSLRH